MRIDRCICYGRTFADLVNRAQEHGIENAEALQEVEPFGLNCRLCLPYMRHALRTGETVFHRVLDEDEFDAEP